MKKDTIYIDVEDDITAVIEKLKHSSSSIVALVPPKGNMVLQSIVNLRLLAKTAKSSSKQPVIVTTAPALARLASDCGIYVAASLNSKPELVQNDYDHQQLDDDIIVSDDIGLLDGDRPDDITVREGDQTEVITLDEPALQKAAAEAKGSDSTVAKKIPDFNRFRKKLLIGGGVGLLLLIILLVIFGRTRADITIRAETSSADIATEFTVSATATNSDTKSNVLRAERQEVKKTLTQKFTATGQKDIGKKAGGTMTLTRTSVSSVPLTVPSGTEFSSGGLIFISTQAAQLAGSSVGPGGIIQDSADVSVVAVASGDRYNVSARSYNSSAAGVDADGSQMSGGTTEVVTVISQADIDKAKALIDVNDTGNTKDDLRKLFDKQYFILDGSLQQTVGEARSEPALDQQAQSASLSLEISYVMLAVAKTDIQQLLSVKLKEAMDDPGNQRVYNDGFERLGITQASPTGPFKLATVGQFGPQFDTAKLKGQIAGKKLGEARSVLEALPGVKGVDTKLSPFWARQLPNRGRITITLDVDKVINR